MGKKSKRRGGKRKPERNSNELEKFLRIERNVEALIDKGVDLAETYLYPAAHCKYSKALSIIKSEKKMLLKNHFEFYHRAYSLYYINTMMLYCTERRFEEMIDLYTKAPFELLCKDDEATVAVATAVRTLDYNLALMVTGKLDASQAALALHKFTFTKEGISLIKGVWQPYIFEFCRLKKWDEALDLNNRVGNDLDSCTQMDNSHFIRVMIYVERYRVEALKRPRTQRNKMSVSLYKYISMEMYNAIKNLNVSPHSYYICLLYSQWLYLNRNGTSTSEAVIKGRRKLRGKSSSNSHVKFCDKCREETSISESTLLCNSCQENELSRILGKSLAHYVDEILPIHVTSNSCSCCKAKLPDVSALVCGGCRVACFCSLDHQRSSWKRDMRGLGIGHKMLCPLLKAHRKYKDAKRIQKDNVREYLLRFDRECENFFSKTLGLEDLCFSKEFVDQNDEGCIGLITKSFTNTV